MDEHDDYQTPTLWSANEPTRPIDEPARVVGHGHPETAQKMERHTFPRSGSFRRQVYDYLVFMGDRGATDDELEVAFGRSHQSTSGCRSTLKKDGWVVASRQVRVNRWGNEAIVWVARSYP